MIAKIGLPLFLALNLVLAPIGALAEPTAKVEASEATFGGELEMRHPMNLAAIPLTVGAHFALTAGLLVFPFATQASSGMPLSVSLSFLAAGALSVAAGIGLYKRGYYSTQNPLDRWITRLLLRRLQKRIKKLCPECRFEEVTQRGYGIEDLKATRVIYPDGWWFQLAGDPLVAEFQHKPSTPSELTRNEGRLKNHLFRAAAEIGLKPSQGWDVFSSNHVNIGTRLFEGRGDWMRDFIVDFYNHYELAMGVWLDDPWNAPTLMKDPEQRMAFQKAIEDFDAMPDNQRTVKNLVKILHKRVLTGHNRALSLRNARRSVKSFARRLELRANRASISADHYLTTVKILQARIDYLKNRDERVPFENQEPSRDRSVHLERYRAYVEESGFDWGEASFYLTPEYQKLLQGERYQSSSESCESILSERSYINSRAS